MRARELQPQPWRNGGGTTREIAVAPGDGHPFPAWRLSLATIATDGPFSTFPGVDRSLLLVSPTVLQLTVDGAATRLGQHDVLDFPGEATVHATTGGAASEALNLLTCRGCFGGSWALRTHDGPGRVSSADAVALVLLDGSATVDGEQLQRYDALVPVEAPTAVVFRSARIAAVERSTAAPASHA